MIPALTDYTLGEFSYSINVGVQTDKNLKIQAITKYYGEDNAQYKRIRKTI